MSEEGDAPSTADSAQTTLEKLTSMWVRMDGLFERIKGALELRKESAVDTNKEKSAIEAHHAGVIEQDARGGGNISKAEGGHVHEGNTKLIPWLMLTAVLAGIAVGISIVVVVNTTQSESRMRAELDRQNRFLQEYRIRVEDAEIAAEEVNPKFHPRRTE